MEGIGHLLKLGLLPELLVVLDDLLFKLVVLLFEFLGLYPLLLAVQLHLVLERLLILLLLDFFLHQQLHRVGLKNVPGCLLGGSIGLELSQTILNERLLIGDIGRVLVTLLGRIDVGLLGGRLTLCLPFFLDVYGLTFGQRAVEGDGTLAGIIIEVSPALIL